ncbi:MAG: hypothetical protein PWP46_916 [Fusobacteriaceae bacterium]|jgi:curved DNA-binding protein CbpA|nr:hypothetical protein [Fusobacteriales bacterium]MDN5304037.1 hypothetical protein [Fusobacteriaceae bacterium]
MSYIYSDYVKAIEILELPLKFSLKTLKKQYKKLLKINHPDLTKKENKKIQEIKESYKILINYIENYEISFEEKDFKQSPEEFYKNKLFNDWRF